MALSLRLAITFTSLLTLLPLTTANSGAWGQCGGVGWTGATSCVVGYSCTFSNKYYSQCLPSAPPSTPPSTVPTSTTLSFSLLTGASNPGLLNIAKAAGKKYFGRATDNPELTNTAYVAGLSNTNYFGQLTPDATEPSRGTFNFSGGDVIVSLAQKNGQILRGHNCVWHNQLPSWVTSGNFNSATLQSIIKTHCRTVVGHYKGKIWDVINEPFNDDGSWRSSVFYNTIGPSYVDITLRAARAADPCAKLYINEYNIEGTSAKSTAMFNLVKSLKATGVPIDGIGLQAHLIVGQVPSTIKANMERFTALGVEIAITELDIRMTLPETAALLEQQKQDYQTVVSACKAVAGCVGITIWDYTDRYPWIPSVFSGQGAACPWDANLVKKPAYDGIIDGFTT
ncbi:beta-1,4-endoxylanase [Phlegmacium glaucopus]|nr:beta-1,4-endoxylanase [Phlegmacium glaucopus]